MTKINNFINLFWINFKKNFFKEIILGIGVFLFLSILIIGNSLADTLQNFFKNFIYQDIPIKKIKVNGTFQPPQSISNISPQLIDQISSWPEIQNITPISQARFPISCLFSLNLPIQSFPNKSFILELPVIGIPNHIAQQSIHQYKNLYQETFPVQNVHKLFPLGFYQYNNTIPVLIPRFINQVSQSFIQNNQLPNLNILTLLIGFIDIKFLVNYSITHSQAKKQLARQQFPPIQGKVIGFLNPILGPAIAIPQNTLESIKKSVLKNQKSEFESIIINIKDQQPIQNVKQKLTPILQKFNLKLEEESSFQKITHYIKKILQLLKIVINSFSAIILFISCVATFYAFSYLFFQRQKEFTLYRFFGASQTLIISMLTLESFLMTSIASASAYFLSYYFLIHYLPSQIQFLLQLLPPQITSLFQNQNILFPFDHSQNLFFLLLSITSSSLPALIPPISSLLRSPFRKYH